MREHDVSASVIESVTGQLFSTENILVAVNTLKLSKPEKAAMVEQMICRMAQMGQLAEKMDDSSFVQLLESVNQQMPRSTSNVKFDRRRAAIDSDDDDDYGL